MVKIMTSEALKNNLNSRLSIKPLVEVLKTMREQLPGARKLYSGLLKELESKPNLLQPLQEQDLVANAELLETLLTTIFPPATANNQDLYAVSFPFQMKAIFASPGFKSVFLDENNDIQVPDRQATVDISKANATLAYNLILKKYYNLPMPVSGSTVHAFTNSKTGLKKYFELDLDAQFVEVHRKEDYTLPEDIRPEAGLSLDELREIFDLNNFYFEGLFIIYVTDVTQEQVVTTIKNELIDIDAFSDADIYEKLQLQLQSLLELENVQIGLTPFFRKNGIYLYTRAHSRNSIILGKAASSAEKDQVSRLCKKMFQHQQNPLLYKRLNDSHGAANEVLRMYRDIGAESLLLCPLYGDNGNLIGLLEIMSRQPGLLTHRHLLKIQPAIELFALALEKVNEGLEMQIDKTIKEHFTAIQPAVEWRFTEAAFTYLQQSQLSEMAKMPAISFEDVYPIFGSIDIRNSSVERNNAIQLDLLEQLTLAQDCLARASKVIEFPLLKEIQFRLSKFVEASTDTLLSDDEIQIYEFLETQLNPMIENLVVLKPELKQTMDTYLNALDPQRKIVYHHRKEYEESITKINEILDRFIDQEQRAAQEIYPHYFERYFTDGVEFNIYVGQSLSPQIPFNELYVRNLKLWQLAFLARAARITGHLEKRLPLPLQTTQLILAQAIPLSITFRKKERKFDVDGAYNIRYEIVKKRIDKVHIRDTEERLTQPGTIAIVYSQQKEATEYLEYVEFLQNEKLLGNNVEHLELEDTQGISGLKAIRVDINLKSEGPHEREPFTKRLHTGKPAT